MSSYIQQGTIVLLILLLVWSLKQENPVNQELVKQNRELLNRLQSPDVPTFQALQTSSKTDSAPSLLIPKDDETEAEQLKNLYGPGTLVLDSEDVGTYAMQDFGFGFKRDEE